MALDPSSFLNAVVGNAQVADDGAVYWVQLLLPRFSIRRYQRFLPLQLPSLLLPLYLLAGLLDALRLLFEEDLATQVVLLGELCYLLGVAREVSPSLLGLCCHLQVDAFEEEAEVVEVLLVVPEDLPVANHGPNHSLVDPCLEQRVDIGKLLDHAVDFPPFLLDLPLDVLEFAPDASIELI